MKILFTKNIDPSIISKELGEDIVVDCVEVIKTIPITINPFELKNFSLIFTSVNGVASFFKNRFKPNEDFTAKNYNKIYCVGEKTKRALRKHGFGTFKVLKNAEMLSRFIIGHCQHEQFLHFCGNLAINVLDKDLPLQNIKYQKVTLYNTEEINPLIAEKYHAAVFFSPSGVRSFAKRNSLEDMKLFSIGETTSGELRNFTQKQIFTSEENTLTSIFELIRREMENRF
ncbi:uroporphyrinogen-III synthase [Chryseobacterium lactis]|uniref:Uroporphyrinogen-III synthase n=1 Tax=Chryseobacterium lactis TaxID=1241981 RepID=A0A3G6RNQ6_CHRLC|nr:uroporphyrinogen-III synthase [Chryseobacterium lactis]AZA81547.1 uroporphyrinogen-III synthase [Chryseobacterium lactis]AZB06545.1 uroporphyrinogen-III synthase [Chryseobacterium lactis]PNW15396.1 uroporphyrinogen-III synthase [Chryseobacterium lactis]